MGGLTPSTGQERRRNDARLPVGECIKPLRRLQWLFCWGGIIVNNTEGSRALQWAMLVALVAIAAGTLALVAIVGGAS